MSASLIDGAEIAQKITEALVLEVKKAGQTPGIAVIRVGENAASEVYVNRKVKKAQEIGFYSEKHELPASVTQEELLRLIDQCNRSQKIHGLLVQLPLPPHIDVEIIQAAVDPAKDVDGFHPVNLGKLLAGTPLFISATPRGIMTLIKSVHPKLAGMNAVVIGRSAIVGKPTAQLLLMEDATVTVCHSKTKNIPEIARQADILVVAIGKPRFVTAEFVKPGATVIDVGINRLPDDTLCGDVDFDSVKELAGHLTPVPGGVGPMTIASLMQNTFEAMQLVQ